MHGFNQVPFHQAYLTPGVVDPYESPINQHALYIKTRRFVVGFSTRLKPGTRVQKDES